MRKFMSVLIAAVIAGNLAGCGANADSGSSTAAPETAQTAETETSGVMPSEESPSLAEPSGEDVAEDEKLSQIHQAVKDAYENYIPSAPYDQAAISELFGVSQDLYNSFIAEGPMISAHVETFVGIAAKEGKGEAVEAALSEYRDSLLSDTLQYPMNLVKIQASQVVRHGDYVFFVMLGSPTPKAEEQGEEQALESAKENNQLAVSIIDSFF